jgi:hypothetical protein
MLATVYLMYVQYSLSSSSSNLMMEQTFIGQKLPLGFKLLVMPGVFHCVMPVDYRPAAPENRLAVVMQRK